jgi:sarcinarray family protein
MRKNRILEYAVALSIIILSFSITTAAGECEYGTMFTWYSTDGETWERATVDDAYLKLAEPFYIKTNITTKLDNIWVGVKLWETGEKNATGSSFEVLEGPVEIYEILNMGTIPDKNSEFEYTWKMRIKPYSDWAGGNAPLNIRAQFNINDYEDCEVYFTIANVHIINELWEGYTEEETDNNETNGGGSTPGFEIIIVLLALIIIMFFRRKHKL